MADFQPGDRLQYIGASGIVLTQWRIYTFDGWAEGPGPGRCKWCDGSRGVLLLGVRLAPFMSGFCPDRFRRIPPEETAAFRALLEAVDINDPVDLGDLTK